MATEIDFDRYMDATQTVIQLKPGVTLTAEQVAEIQYAFDCERQHEDDAVDAFHNGYLHGLRKAAGADVAALLEKIDALNNALAVEKALSRYRESAARPTQEGA